MPEAVYGTPDDVADLWQPIPDAQLPKVVRLLAKASAKLRQKCPFDIDQRIALFQVDPEDPGGLDPGLVADVTAGIVKRVLGNPAGALSTSETVGPYSRSQVFANRYTKGAGDLGSLYVSDDDVDQLRVAVPAVNAATIRLRPGLPSLGLQDGDPWVSRPVVLREQDILP